MFYSQHRRDAAAGTPQEMQEIEVVSMDDGDDAVTASSPRSSSPASSFEATTPRSPPPPSPPFGLGTPSRSPQDRAVDVLAAMLEDEGVLRPVDPRARARVRATPITASSASSSGPFSTSARVVEPEEEEEEPVNDRDRVKMCDWYYEMSDFLKVDDATASRALRLLDRFMASVPPPQSDPPSSTSPPARRRGRRRPASERSPPRRPGADVAGVVAAASRDRDEYQLAALTALFLSIKLFERLDVQPEHVSYLSRGRYGAEEVVRMEGVMLAALEWKACQADRADFIEAVADVLVPEGGSDGRDGLRGRGSPRSHQGRPRRHGRRWDEEEDSDPLRSSLKELAHLQIQRSDFDSSFAIKRPSTVAFAAVVNAFEMRGVDRRLVDEEDRRLFLEGARRIADVLYPPANVASEGEKEELAEVMERLRALVEPRPPAPPTPPPPPSSGSGPGASNQWERFASSPFQTPHQAPDRHPSSSSASAAASSSHVSPLDMALESMEGFEVAFCCGGGDHAHRHGSGRFALGQDPAAAAAAASHPTTVEAVVSEEEDDLVRLGIATSFGSVENQKGKDEAAEDHRSPTSIAAILFGPASD
ncbi:hypothetical protein ACHAWF_013427 [Thalassiosira exigua]